MRAPPYLRALTPWGWAVAAAALLAAGLIVLHGLGFRWDPLGLAERRLKSAEAGAQAARADAAGRSLEVEGAGDQTRRLEQAQQQSLAVARATGQATTGARIADDADIPLDPDRAARLGGHDRELCRLAPAVCGAAETDAADGGGDPLRAGAAARGADPR